MNTLSCDVAIFGGGIAGLMTLAACKKAGYDAVLFEKTALGCGQTGFSQGILHAGLKYALSGRLNAAAQTVSDAISDWTACMAGEGLIDAQNLNILSDHHDLCHLSGMTASFKALATSAVLKSESSCYAELPSMLKSLGFSGAATRVQEWVIDVPDLVSIFHKAFSDVCCKIDTLHYQDQAWTITQNGETYQLDAKQVVLTTGEMTASLLPKTEIQQQKRPLHMVAVRAPGLQSCFAHIVKNTPPPELTITTHTDRKGQIFWYLGGALAEKGVGLSKEQQFQRAQRYLSQFFKAIDWQKAHFASIPIDRAEGKTEKGGKPDGPITFWHEDTLCLLPTKLVLAPAAAKQVLVEIKKRCDLSVASPQTWSKNWPSPKASDGIRGVFDGQTPLGFNGN